MTSLSLLFILFPMINDNLQSQLRLIYENMIAKANSNQIKGNFVTVKEMADNSQT